METTRKSNNSGKGHTPVMDRVAAGAHDAVDKAAEAAAAATKLVGKKGDDLMAAQERYLESCRDRVRANPLAAIGVALAAGIALSLLLARR